MQTDSTGYPHLQPGLGSSLGQASAHTRGQAQNLGQQRITDDAPVITSGQSGTATTHSESRLDQLSFSDSVRILSDAMKAQVRSGKSVDAFAADDSMAALEGTEPGQAGQSLNHLLDALGSALDKAGLEKGNQAALNRILGEIRHSVQYGPKGYATGLSGQAGEGSHAAKQGVIRGQNPGLLNLSA